MKSILVAAAGAIIAFTFAAPADAKGAANLEKQCKRMLQQRLGVEPQPADKGRRGKTGGGASAYYTQIQNCVANGGRL